jgi:hypothetical protein
VESAGRGQLRVIFTRKNPNAEIHFNISGADVLGIEPRQLVRPDGSGGWSLLLGETESATLTLDLDNLNSISNVVISAADHCDRKKVALPPISVPVLEGRSIAPAGRSQPSAK